MDKIKQPSLLSLQDQVDQFNAEHHVGTQVNLRLDSGEVKTVTVKHKATILGGHSAVGWFEEVSGCYALRNVQPLS